MVEQEGRSEESTNPSFALLTSEFLNFLKTTDSLNFLSLILGLALMDTFTSKAYCGD